MFVGKKSTFIKSQGLSNTSNDQFKMNKIMNKLLLTGDKFMPELVLKQPGLFALEIDLYLEKASNLKHLYRNKLDKACFAYDAAYFDSNKLAQINYFR